MHAKVSTRSKNSGTWLIEGPGRASVRRRERERSNERPWRMDACLEYWTCDTVTKGPRGHEGKRLVQAAINLGMRCCCTADRRRYAVNRTICRLI